MNEQNQIHELRIRVDELEKSNDALWAWVKTLASQDAMLLQWSVRFPDRSPEWAEAREEILNQIIDNNRLINNLPVPENDE